MLKVVHAENVVAILDHIHGHELKHSGYRKVLEYSQRSYYGITRPIVQKYCVCCPVCQLSAPQIARPPLKPIIQKDFLERVQIDLIDMRHNPDGEYRYIAHFMDHFSKFHVLFPLKTKSAVEVATLLEERVLAYFGPPNIFHSDNGREFVNQIMRSLLESWGADITLVHGRPRHSQSQGLVERGNRTVEKKIAAMKADIGLSEDNYPWASWLPRIMYSLNTELQRTVDEVPYKIVFGKSPPTSFPGAANIVNEEDIDDEEFERDEQQANDYRPTPMPRKRQYCPTPLPRTNKEPTPLPRAPQSAPTIDTTPDTETDQTPSEVEPIPLLAPIVDATPDTDTNPTSSEVEPTPLPRACTQSAPTDDTDTEVESTPLPSEVEHDDSQFENTRHGNIRKRAYRKTVAAAERMEDFYNKSKRVKSNKYNVGDHVTVSIPKLDRASTDYKRMPAIVTQVHGNKQLSYSLATEYGRLKSKYRAGDLEWFSGKIKLNIQCEVSMREAAKKQNPQTLFTKAHCNCVSRCTSKKCPCLAKSINCSTHCHSSRPCDNNQIYCLCRGPEQGFMVQCCKCKDWFHGKCVGIVTEDDEKDVEQRDWNCLNC